MEWQPIETAPKDGTSCLVVAGDGNVGEASWCGPDGWWWINTHLEHWADSIDFRHGEPTHWMPLPDPPKTSAT